MARVVKKHPTTTTTPAPTTPTTAPPRPVNVTGASPYRSLGNTTREAFKTAMRRSVTTASPPFAAALDGMYDALAAKGVTRLAPPMSWMECKNSTWPQCGVPMHARNPWAVTGAGDAGQSGRWAMYSSYIEAARAWAKLVTEGSPYRNAKSIAEFIHIYAPASDNNDERAYVQVIADGVNALPLSGTTPGTPPVSPPTPVQDPIAVIVGGAYPPIDYGWLADAGLGYYQYGVGHGTTRSTQHTGYDVGVPLGTRLFTPISGTIDCVGGRGTPRWGQGCGAYKDDLTGGVGNITIFGDTGHKLTLGHCNRSLVAPGDRVTAGQPVGTSGGMNGPHVHVEVSVLRNGTYWLLDPGPALREAMGGAPVVTYAERVPVPQPDDFDAVWDVEVLVDGVPVLQRASPHAPAVASPFKKGEHFRAVYVACGEDGAPYWVGTHGGRVPMKGTKGPDWS